MLVESLLAIFFLVFCSRKNNSCLGFIDGPKHSFTPFDLIPSFFSLIFARVLSEFFLVVEEQICERLEGRLKATLTTFDFH